MADDEGCGIVIAVIAIVAVVCFVVAVVIPYVILPAGVALGGGFAIHNYVKSFINNVRPEGDPNGWIAKGIMVVLGLCVIAVVVLVIIDLTEY